MKENLRIRNIGILAHIDAGKTTVTEHLLYESGATRTLGSVDKGTARTDNLEVEKERGISVRAAEAVLTWKDTEIHIIDTPGHVDFTAEVERALRILDGAVVVISAVEGVQPQTEVYFKALKAMKIPTLIFINKVDRIGADTKRILQEIGKSLTKDALPMQIVAGEETINPEIVSIFNEDSKNSTQSIDLIELMDKIIEKIADKDEEVLNKYLEGEEIPADILAAKLIEEIHRTEIYPVLYGTAIKGIGIRELLDALVQYLPAPKGKDDEELSAVVFKVQQHKTLGKLAFVRLYSGEIQSRNIIYNRTKDVEEKVTLIKKLSVQKEIDTTEVKTGEIAALAGLSTATIGDILGTDKNVPKVPSLAIPILTVKVQPKEEAKYTQVVEAFQQLDEEDPALHVELVREKKEIHIHIMGMIQLEILESILKDRFNLEVVFGKPAVIYKETPSKRGFGFAAYTMPKPCWAITRFEIEPLERGAGLIYESRIRTEHIKVRYQREVERAVPKALTQGVYGWEVIDLKVTLIEGEDHVMHSNSGDFLIATPMAIMDGLSSIGTTLLEPMLHFRISIPEEAGGKVLGDLINRRGTFESPVIVNGRFTVEGEMPVATSLDYPIRLGIISGGRGIINTKFAGYKPCPIGLGAVRERIGVNPMDRAKFILSMRNAI
jgi:ribosomal protection tetracycline resistance protein